MVFVEMLACPHQSACLSQIHASCHTQKVLAERAWHYRVYGVFHSK